MIQHLKFIIRIVPRGFLYSTIDKLFSGFYSARNLENISTKIIDDWKIVQDKNFILGSKSQIITLNRYSDKEISLIHILSKVLKENLVDKDKRAVYLFDLKLLDIGTDYHLLESFASNILEDIRYDNSFITEYLRNSKFFDLSNISLRFIADCKSLT